MNEPEPEPLRWLRCQKCGGHWFFCLITRVDNVVCGNPDCMTTWQYTKPYEQATPGVPLSAEARIYYKNAMANLKLRKLTITIVKKPPNILDMMVTT